VSEVINIALLDGNQAALEVYAKLCQVVGDNYGYTLNVKTFSNTQQFLFEMQDSLFMHTTDILIVDPELVGEAIPRTIRKMGYKGVILYLTNSDSIEVLMKAFDAGALNILQKGEPNLSRFKKVMERALDKAGSMQREYILLKSKGECIRLSLRDIYYFAALDHFITAYHNGGEFQFRATISELEERLSRYGFVRVNKSYLAAVAYIMSVTNDALTLSDGTELPIGRNFYPQLKKYSNNMAVLDTSVVEEEEDVEKD
jgi:DNA-binding LytR/AlgR family response regulator